MRNNEHYIDPTAQTAIKRADRTRKRKPKTWGDMLAYTMGEVMKINIPFCHILGYN